jgi:putative addiction module component (TIGR02574 family)
LGVCEDELGQLEYELPFKDKNMQLSSDTILEAALKLPESERLELATRLLDTVPPGIMSVDDPEFIAELDRRFNDNSPGVPWSEIRDRK